jgi:hypothetical protein
VDSGCALGRIFRDHLENQIAHFFGDLPSAKHSPPTGNRSQYSANPARCQPTTVSGLTTMRVCFQPDQNLWTTQKSLSSKHRRGLGCFRLNTRSCCRRVRFSSIRLRRERKQRSSKFRTRPMACNMAACYRKRPVDNKSYVVDSKGGQSFGRDSNRKNNESVVSGKNGAVTVSQLGSW